MKVRASHILVQTKEEADNFEKLLIEQLNLINPDKGYNLKEGGSKGNFSENSKIKMRENHADFSGKNNPQYGKKHTEETKMKISLAKIVILKPFPSICIGTNHF